jgi:hypothetical protein
MSSATEVISHWSTLIEDFQYSPQRFYEQVAEAVRKRQIPDSKIGKVQFKEGNFLTARREYLRIHYKNEFYFAICGAPFGTGFFVSWWLLQAPEGCLLSLLSLLPGLSSIGRAMAGPWTYYRADTASMFQTATHSAVMEVVDSMVNSVQNIRPLSESERKPIMRELFDK